MKVTKYALIAALSLAGLAAPKLAQADTTYTYTGAAFSSFEFLTCPADCSIDGSFTAPTLAANTTTAVSPSSFDFHVAPGGADFPSTLPPPFPVAVNDFFITTDSSGAIVSWFISLSEFGGQSLNICSAPVSTAIYSCSTGDGYGDNPGGITPGIEAFNSTAGTWTTPTTTTGTPEPSSLVLLFSALVALALLSRKLALA